MEFVREANDKEGSEEMRSENVNYDADIPMVGTLYRSDRSHRAQASSSFRIFSELAMRPQTGDLGLRCAHSSKRCSMAPALHQRTGCADDRSHASGGPGVTPCQVDAARILMIQASNMD